MNEDPIMKSLEDGIADVLQKTGSDVQGEVSRAKPSLPGSLTPATTPFVSHPAPRPLQRVMPATGEPTLSDQIVQYERISRIIADKIRKEQVAIRNDYELKWVEVNAAYASRISEETSKLEKARDQELLSLTETTSRKLHELEQLARRSG